MSRLPVRELIFAPVPEDLQLPDGSEPGRHLAQHIAAAVSLLEHHEPTYRDLRRRWEQGELDDAERVDALDAAQDIAAVQQSLGRRQWLLFAVEGGARDPSVLLGVLDQVFFSFCALAGAEDDFSYAAMPEDELDDLLVLADLPRFLGWLQEVRPGP